MPTGSPGDGITPALLSREPLATEGEATPGPDDWNPYAEMEDQQQKERFKRELDSFDGPKASLPDFDEPGEDFGFGPSDDDVPMLFEDLPRFW